MKIDFTWSIDDWMDVFRTFFTEIERFFARLKAVIDGTYVAEEWTTVPAAEDGE